MPSYRAWSGEAWVEVPVAEMTGEALAVANVNAIIHPSGDPELVLLQRRDKAGESVRGRWEIPGGRIRAGEEPLAALRREIREETGLVVETILGSHRRYEPSPNLAFAMVHPIGVVVGFEGAYPSLHLVFACTAHGEPRAQPGETADPRFFSVPEVEDMVGSGDELVFHTRAMLRLWLDRGR